MIFKTVYRPEFYVNLIDIQSIETIPREVLLKFIEQVLYAEGIVEFSDLECMDRHELAIYVRRHMASIFRHWVTSRAASIEEGEKVVVDQDSLEEMLEDKELSVLNSENTLEGEDPGDHAEGYLETEKKKVHEKSIRYVVARRAFREYLMTPPETGFMVRMRKMVASIKMGERGESCCVIDRMKRFCVQSGIILVMLGVSYLILCHFFPYESEDKCAADRLNSVVNLTETWKDEWLSAMFDSPVRDYLHGAGPFLFPGSPDGFKRIRSFVQTEKGAVETWKSKLDKYKATQIDPSQRFANNVEKAEWLIEGREKEIKNIEGVVDLLESRPGKWRKGPERIEFSDEDLEREFVVCERSIGRIVNTYLGKNPAR